MLQHTTGAGRRPEAVFLFGGISERIGELKLSDPKTGRGTGPKTGRGTKPKTGRGSEEETTEESKPKTGRSA